MHSVYARLPALEIAVYFLPSRLLRWRLPALEIAVLLQPIEDLLEDQSQYSIILNTETDILHYDTETDILLLTDIFCIEEACVCYKLVLYSPWERLYTCKVIFSFLFVISSLLL